MRRGDMIGVLLLVSGAATPAEALTVTVARINQGVVGIAGRGAASNAAMTWEGQAAGQAAKNRSFKVNTALLPPDCTGALSDGVTTLSVVIQGDGPCRPSGRRRPPPQRNATPSAVGSSVSFQTGAYGECSARSPGVGEGRRARGDALSDSLPIGYRSKTMRSADCSMGIHSPGGVSIFRLVPSRSSQRGLP